MRRYQMSNLKKDIENAINKASREDISSTADYILAEYLLDCLRAYEKLHRNKLLHEGILKHPEEDGSHARVLRFNELWE